VPTFFRKVLFYGVWVGLMGEVGNTWHWTISAVSAEEDRRKNML